MHYAEQNPPGSFDGGFCQGIESARGDVDGLRPRVDRHIVSQPLDTIGRSRGSEPLFDAFEHHVTDHLARGAGQVNSNPSEHQRKFERSVATFPLYSRFRRRRVCRASGSPRFFKS